MRFRRMWGEYGRVTVWVRRELGVGDGLESAFRVQYG